MSSIAVVVSRSGVPDSVVVRRMLEASPHRGDVFELTVCGHVALGISHFTEEPSAYLSCGDLSVAFTGQLDNGRQLAPTIDARFRGGKEIDEGRRRARRHRSGRNSGLRPHVRLQSPPARSRRRKRRRRRIRTVRTCFYAFAARTARQIRIAAPAGAHVTCVTWWSIHPAARRVSSPQRSPTG